MQFPSASFRSTNQEISPWRPNAAFFDVKGADILSRNNMFWPEQDGDLRRFSVQNSSNLAEACWNERDKNGILTLEEFIARNSRNASLCSPEVLNLSCAQDPHILQSMQVMMPSTPQMRQSLTLGENSNASLSPESNTTVSENSSAKKRCILASSEDKLREQRQRRMIKNRESAQRSRERKQAYTAQLEFEVKKLKDENSRLRKELLIATLLAEEKQQKPPKRLRRANSFPW